MTRLVKHAHILNLSVGFTLIWGAFLAWPYTETFKIFPRLYDPMRSIYDSEYFWGGGFIATGLA